jgi:hypothetical protein
VTLFAFRRRQPGRLRWTRTVVGALLLAALSASSASGQRAPASWTIGPQVGRPGGLTVKHYRASPIAYDALLTVDGDDFVRMAAYRVWERPLPDSLVYLFYGPGLAATGRQLDVDPAYSLGLGAKLGLNFYAERFEVFLHVTPTLRFRPRPELRLGGGVGLRYSLTPI